MLNPPASTCSRCGADLPARALAGLCPQCLIRVSLRSLIHPTADPGRAAEFTPPPRLGDFELIEEIGRGGMGVVWRARQSSLNRVVALKMIRGDILENAAARQRFRAEAEAAATLNHPNIVPVFEVGEAEGHSYFAMQLVEGGTLAGHLADGLWSTRHCPAHKKPVLPWPCRPRCCPRGAALVAKLARAVHHAHQHGVLHRDLKPGNILLAEDGEPHITDFGLARWLDFPASGVEPGEVAGTPSYLAPEQSTGSALVTTGADIYSLGAILYHILTGRPPFLAETSAATLRQAREELPPAPRALNPDVDRDLEAIALKCLEKDPANRYASAAGLADDLDRWSRAENIRARKSSLWERLCRWTRRKPAVAGLSALALLLLVVGVAGVGWEARRANRHEALAEASLERLWEATPALAQADRASPQAGWRGKALTAIATAARVRPSTALRNEAIAALAQADLLPAAREWPVPAGSQRVRFSRNLEWVAQQLSEPPRWRVARLEDDAEIAVFQVPNVAGETPVFSPRDRYLGFRSATSDGNSAELFVWDLVRRTLLVRCPAATEGNCDFAPDESAVAFFAAGGGVRLAFTGDPDRLHQALPDASKGLLCFASDGRLAVVEGDRVRLIEPLTGRVLHDRRLGFSSVACAGSPNGQWLAFGSLDHGVRLWSPGLPGARLLGSHDGLVHHVEFSPTGGLLVSNGYDGSSRFWELSSGRPVAFTQQGYAQQFSRDGGRVGWFRTRHSYGTWVFSPSPVYRTCRLPGPGRAAIHSAELDATGRWVLIAGDDGVHFLSTTNDTVNAVVPLAGARAARWWLRHPAVLAATSTGLVRVPVAMGEPAAPPRPGSPEWLVVPGLTGLVDAWCSADGRQVLALSEAKAWLVSFGDTPPTARLLDGRLSARGRHARLSPDARWAAISPDYNQGTSVFDPTGQFPRRDLHPRVLSRAAFSQDGRWFADGCFDAVTVLDTATWQPVLRWARDSASDLPGLAAFAPDGRMLAFTPHLRRIQLADLRTGTEVATLTAPDLGMLSDLFFSGDGGLLGALTSDDVVQLWNLAELRQELARHGLDSSAE